jgi:hypothetical protein
MSVWRYDVHGRESPARVCPVNVAMGPTRCLNTQTRIPDSLLCLEIVRTRGILTEARHHRYSHITD